jgi:hypothetical protein
VLKGIHRWVAGVAAVLALSLPTAVAIAAPGANATTGKATTAKKKCKKAKAKSAAKKKCKRSPSVRVGGNYTMSVRGGPSFGLFRYAGAGLYPNPRPVIVAPDLDSDFLNCTHMADGSPLHSIVEGAGYTYPDLKATRFSFSFPPAGVPEWVRGQIHMEGHWVSPGKIVGFFKAQGIGYERPLDPDEETVVWENYSCTDVATPFVAIANALAY